MTGPIKNDEDQNEIFIKIICPGSENRSTDHYSNDINNKEENMDLSLSFSKRTVSSPLLTYEMVTSKSSINSPVEKYTKQACEESKVEEKRVVLFKKSSSLQEWTKGMKDEKRVNKGLDNCKIKKRGNWFPVAVRKVGIKGFQYLRKQKVQRKHSFGLNGLSGLIGQKDESGVPGNMGSAGADGDQRQPGRLSGERATGSENFPGKVLNPRPNKVLKGQPGEPGRFGLLGMVGSAGDAGERGDIGLSGLPGQEGEVGESFPGENGFPGPKRLAGFDGTAVLKGEKGIQGEPSKPLNTLPIDIHKECREQGIVVGHTRIPGLKGLLVLVTLSCVFIPSSAKCILTKKVTGSDQCISIQVCHSTECNGTERWDRSKERKLEHIYIEGAPGGSKMSERYTLERDNNCSILSIENVTKEDIFEATYQFVIGTSDKTKIQLKHEPILYKTNDGDPIKCNGDIARLTINMTVMHIRKHPSFKYYPEREDFNKNLTVSQSSEKIGLWFVTTIFSVINIRENNFNETFYLVYKDTKSVIIFDESVICNESKVTVGSISKGNKTPVVVPTVIVLAVIVALLVLFGWCFRKKIIQCCRGASQIFDGNTSDANREDSVNNGEVKFLMNTSWPEQHNQHDDSVLAENYY